ncbi:MAG TPA: hypothetical protein VN860_05600 [Candidatus Acidoferrales bacterium]|nr:hypothetical protein [Candidatus Acidoferrales bacterium]
MQEAEMEGWQQRVIDEKRALDERLAKLVAFLSKGEPDELLWRQKVLMLEYSYILGERIKRFTPT